MLTERNWNPWWFVSKKIKPKLKFPSELFVHFHEKGRMDENGVNLWIKNIWNSRPDWIKKQRAILAWNMIYSHVIENTKSRSSRINTYVAIMSRDLTSLLLLLDEPFKTVCPILLVQLKILYEQTIQWDSAWRERL